MNVSCSAKSNACPLLLSSACVFYEGENLIYIDVNMNDSLQTALEKLNVAFSTLQGDITLTTIGSSGPSTFLSNTLNIPVYSLSGLGGSLQAVTDIGSITTNVITASGLTLTAQPLGVSTYSIGQVMASDDSWRIYGFANTIDNGDLIFELEDNAALINGQRFRFRYGNISSGTPKDILLMNYDGATIDGTLQVNNLAGIGTRMVVADSVGLLSTAAYPTSVNIYNSDGTLTGNRTVDTSTYQISFTGSNPTLNTITTGTNASTDYAGMNMWDSSGALVGSFQIGGVNAGTPELRGHFFFGARKAGGNVYIIDSNGTPVHGFYSSGNVGINTGTSMLASAQFQINSTTRGFLPPRMTTTQRNAIVSPATGLSIYNTTTLAPNVYNGTAWVGVGGLAIGDTITSATAGSVLFAGTSGVLAQNNANLFWDDTNNRLGIGTATPTLPLDVVGEAKVNGLIIGKGFNTLANIRLTTSSNSLINVTTGTGNVVVGDGGQAITSGTNNFMLGALSAFRISTGSNNISIGSESLLNTTTQSNNIALGNRAGAYQTGFNNLTPTSCIYIGNNCFSGAVSPTNEIVIGNGTNTIGLGSNTTIIGNSSTITTALRGRLILGTTTDSGLYQLDVNGTARVTGDMVVNTITIGKGNGALAENTVYGYQALAVTTASFNTAIGYQTLKANTTGFNNTAIGAFSLSQNIIGNNNTAIGISSLYKATGSTNTTLGNRAGFNVTTGQQNTFIGGSAAGGTADITASNNASLGNATFFSLTSGSENVALGSNSLFSLSTGANNSAVGIYSLYNIISGGNNIGIGSRAGIYFGATGTDALTIATGSIYIGNNTRALVNSNSNEVVIGYNAVGLGSNTTTIGSSSTITTALRGRLILGTTTDAATGNLQVTGVSSFTGTTLTDGGQLGAELTTTGSGTNWTGTGFSTGYTHTTGSVVALTTSLAAVSSTSYQLTYTITGRTAGSVVIAYGGFTSGNITATGTTSIRATATTSFSVTPTTDFDGTIVMSIKAITAGTATLILRNSSGTITNEIRSTTLNTNVFMGVNSGTLNTTGFSNVGIGISAMQFNTTGYANVAIGDQALYVNSSGANNVAIGFVALTANTTGAFNFALGWQSMFSNTTGTQNVAIGASSLRQNISGGNNIAIGNEAVRKNTTASGNIGIGTSALYDNTTGANNISLGTSSLGANTTGSNNIAIGLSALGANTTASFNTVVGYAGILANTTGANNCIFGYEAGRYVTAGTLNTLISNSILIGYDARPNASSETNEIVIGYAERGLGSNTTIIGNSSTITTALRGRLLLGTTTDTGLYQLDVVGGDARINGATVGKGTSSLALNTAVGVSALSGANVTQGGFSNNTAIGYQSMKSNVNGYSNVAVGANSLATNVAGFHNVAIGDGSLTVCTGNYNTAIGSQSMFKVTTGTRNIGIGYNILWNLTTGSNNIAIGDQSSFGLTTGTSNVSIGNSALNVNVSGSQNTAYGFNSLANNSASFNSGTGSYSLEANTSGVGNSSIGYASLTTNTTGSYNIGIGYESGRRIADDTSNTISNNSIYIGRNTKSLANNQTNQIVIGYQTTGLGSNTTIIGNSSTITSAIYGNLLLGTTTDSGLYKLDVVGNGRFTGNLTAISTTASVTAGMLGWSAVNGYVQTTIPASTSFSAIGYAFSSLIGNNYMTYQGSATFAANTFTGAVVGINNIAFTAASSTITITQSSSIRTYSAGLFQNTISGSVNGTITHMSGLAVRPIFRASGTSTITVDNNYGLLIADQNEFSHATITNRWGVYQEGANDNNYFKGKVVIGSTDTVGASPLNVKGLPTSSAGLSTGDVWNDSGILKIV